MNGLAGAVSSNFWTPNLCICGHDYVMHSLAGSGTCSGCVRSGGGSLNIHLFTSDNDVWPTKAFPQSDVARFPIAGSQNQSYFTVAMGTNALNATTVLFASTAGMKAGMAFYLVVAAVPNQAASYIILQVLSGTSVLIAAPGLTSATSSAATAVVSPIDGGFMGGGRPPNGQRAG